MSTSTLESTLKSTPQSTPESTPVSTPKVSSVNLNETDSRDDMSLDSIHYNTDSANNAQEDPKYALHSRSAPCVSYIINLSTPTPEGGSSGTESEQDCNAKTAQWVAKLRNKIADLHKDIDDLYDEIADLQQDLQEQEHHANQWREDLTRHLPLAISLTKLALIMVDSELEVDRLIDVEMYSETSCSEHSDPDLVMRQLSECTGGLSEYAGDEESENDEHEEKKEHGDNNQDEDDDQDEDKEEEEEDKDKDKDNYDGDDEGEDESEDKHKHKHKHEYEHEHESEHGEQEQGDKAENKDEEKNHGVKQEGNKNKQSPESFDYDVVMRRPSEFQSDHNDEESDNEEQEEGEIKEEVQAKDKGKAKEKHEDKEEEKEEGELDEDEEKDDNGEKGKGEEREKGEENGQSLETFDFDIIMRRWSEFEPEMSQSLNELQDLTVFDYAKDASSSDW
ncbi:hypothetical protein FRC12_015255 [Ceratobasidium sp. 428]|nr:hypothetical protein FRC12_015255 [Ceratobasidium sp. 428]